MSKYKQIMLCPNSTVVAEYESGHKTDTFYQSEPQLEKEFINQLVQQGYDYISIKNESQLITNLREQIEKLNRYKFTKEEWEYLLKSELINPNEDSVNKTAKIQDGGQISLTRNDGTFKNITIIDKHNIHNNSLQIINQYENDGARKNRYDVTILVNGLPLVHIELKRRGVALKEAFNQINRYTRESFWSNSGLFQYIQIFVISNGTHTKYYSNTTRYSYERNELNNGRINGIKTSDSFQFTSWWADAKNKNIEDLIDFTKTFFAKHAILNILTKYCVFTTEKKLLVMRPYQIVATERILNKILVSTNHDQIGTIGGGGYIWHTTGSGKTLTSFKAAQLISKEIDIDKILFVVDRKDLDYQTMQEYNKYEAGSVDGTSNTKILQRQLESNLSKKIIVTTIQKLDRFIKNNKNHVFYKKHVVLIFDECHRSQFGEFHKNIIKYFKNYHLFGFTGTPIFANNANENSKIALKTTAQVFGELLHSYTIVDAINDNNVLPFRVDYVNTTKQIPKIKDARVHAIDTNETLMSTSRITTIANYILDKFDQKTMRNKHYLLKDKRLMGFNSILATASIGAAKKYYIAFKNLQKQNTDKLKIALVYSFANNEEDLSDGALNDEIFETDKLDKSSRDFLDSAINDYNNLFTTNYSTSSDQFENYYKDVSKKIKERKIDILIVVNMFLTGLDATTLNTLWVDKNLQYHGLLQAFSRTNRILNDIKVFGNIVCFRDLEQNINDAIALFGNKNARNIVILKSFNDYYYGYDDNNIHHDGYVELIQHLKKHFLISQIMGEQKEKRFIKLYGAILRIKNILSSFDEFLDKEILTEREFQDYQSLYLDLYDKNRNKIESNKASILNDVNFEIELVKQSEISIDYILSLVERYHQSNYKDKTVVLAQINRNVTSNPTLRSKMELINNFIKTINNQSNQKWEDFVNEQRQKDINKIIAKEQLKKDKTYDFLKSSFKNGEVKIIGTEISELLPNMSRFTKDQAREQKKWRVWKEFINIFKKYSDISNISLM